MQRNWLDKRKGGWFRLRDPRYGELTQAELEAHAEYREIMLVCAPKEAARLEAKMVERFHRHYWMEVGLKEEVEERAEVTLANEGSDSHH